MTDTLFADISEYQVPVDDRYPYRFISFRSNDGSYRDNNFQHNLTWAKAKANSGDLAGFFVYLVYEPNWQATFETFKAMVGTPHPKMAVMIDAESWAGRMSGDHSPKLNALREAIIKWLGSHMPRWARVQKLHRKRVVGYGNAYDLAMMWPRRGDINIVLANYSANPAMKNKLAHQFSDRYFTPPFGNCDINSADGLSPSQLSKALGLGPYKKAPVPVPPQNEPPNSIPAPVVKPLPSPRPSPTPTPMPNAEMQSYLDKEFESLRDRIITEYKKKG